jgi:hypothetical protein
MARELVGYFGPDTTSREIAKALMAARHEREATETEQDNADSEARSADPNRDPNADAS